MVLSAALTPAKNLSEVSMKSMNSFPAIVDTGENLDFLVGWTVSTTTGKNFISPTINCCDNRGLFFLQNWELHRKKGQQYLWPSGLDMDTASDGVIGTTMKGCIHRHLSNPNQRPSRLPKPKRRYLLPPKSNTAAKKPIMPLKPPWKVASIDTSRTLTPPKLLQTKNDDISGHLSWTRPPII